MRLALVFVLVLVVGCRASDSHVVSLMSLPAEIPNTSLALFVEKTEVRVTEGLAGKTIARMPRTVGAEVAAPISGRACKLVVLRAGETETTDYQARTKKTRTSTFHTATVELRCSDGPAPGTAALLGGGQPRRTLPWALPGFLLALLAGWLFAREQEGSEIGGGFQLIGVLVGLAALVGTVIVAVKHADGMYTITVAIAFLGVTAAALYAGVAWREYRIASATSLIGVIGGGGIVVALHSTWTAAGPLLALLAAGVGWLVAVVASAMLVDNDKRRDAVIARASRRRKPA